MRHKVNLQRQFHNILMKGSRDGLVCETDRTHYS